MSDYDSLNHSTWECKYHIVWIPKYRRKKLYASIRDDLGQEIRRLAACRECRVLEGHMMIDHVHMLIEMPPKYSIAQVMGYIKGKSAIYIARKYGDRTKYFSGQHFWARGQKMPPKSAKKSIRLILISWYISTKTAQRFLTTQA